jgi:antitoxin VapB
VCRCASSAPSGPPCRRRAASPPSRRALRHKRWGLAGCRPQDVDLVEDEGGIRGHHGGLLELGLRDQQAIEGVQVMAGQLGHAQGVRVLHRQGSHAKDYAGGDERLPGGEIGHDHRRLLTGSIYSVYTVAMKKARAKLFPNGGSQAVRLPKECRFAGEREVLVHRAGRRVILEPADDWSDAFRSSLGSWQGEIPRPRQEKVSHIVDPFN